MFSRQSFSSLKNLQFHFWGRMLCNGRRGGTQKPGRLRRAEALKGTQGKQRIHFLNGVP